MRPSSLKKKIKSIDFAQTIENAKDEQPLLPGLPSRVDGKLKAYNEDWTAPNSNERKRKKSRS